MSSHTEWVKAIASVQHCRLKVKMTEVKATCVWICTVTDLQQQAAQNGVNYVQWLR